MAKRVTRDVFELYGRVTGVGLEYYFRDIEARAEIGTFAKSANKPKDWARRRTDLEQLIRRVVVQTTCDLSKTPAESFNSQIHGDILRHTSHGDTIITFNYDTVIEESWPQAASVWSPRDGYGLIAGASTKGWARTWRAGRAATSKSKSEVQLLKLHGSVNWTLYPTRDVRLKERPYVVKTRKGNPSSEKCEILPPGWHKRIHVNPFRRLWRQARLKLENCSSLAIVGYSLPETDVLARALFMEACRSRAVRGDYLRHLYIADPSQTVKDRFLALFAPALGSMGRVYLYSGIEELRREWQKRGPRR